MEEPSNKDEMQYHHPSNKIVAIKDEMHCDELEDGKSSSSTVSTNEEIDSSELEESHEAGGCGDAMASSVLQLQQIAQDRLLSKEKAGEETSTALLKKHAAGTPILRYLEEEGTPTSTTQAASISQTGQNLSDGITPLSELVRQNPHPLPAGPGAYLIGQDGIRRPGGLEEQSTVLIGVALGELEEREVQGSFGSDIENSGLIQAQPVQEDEEHHRMEAQPVDLDKLDQLRAYTDSKDKKYKRIALGLAVVACLVLMALAFGLCTKKDSNALTENEAPTPSPTRPLPPMDDLELLYVDLPNKTKESLYDIESPQYRAWKWLRNHPNVTFYPEWRKKQIFAIATFFYSFEGPDWPKANPTHNRWMDVNTSECSWFLTDAEVDFMEQMSVTNIGPNVYGRKDYQPCNNDGEIQTLIVCQLFLPTNLKPSIPPEIELLSSLRIIGIAFSQINAKLSAWFVPELIQLPRLQKLSFQASGVHGIVPKELGQMTGLRHLMIGANKLTGTIPSELARMTSLEHVMLDEIEGLTGPLPSEVGRMTSMTALEIAKNSLTGRVPSELGLLSGMSRLALDGNRFFGSLPRQVWDLMQLKRLFDGSN